MPCCNSGDKPSVASFPPTPIDLETEINAFGFFFPGSKVQQKRPLSDT